MSHGDADHAWFNFRTHLELVEIERTLNNSGLVLWVSQIMFSYFELRMAGTWGTPFQRLGDMPKTVRFGCWASDLLSPIWSIPYR